MLIGIGPALFVRDQNATVSMMLLGIVLLLTLISWQLGSLLRKIA